MVKIRSYPAGSGLFIENRIRNQFFLEDQIRIRIFFLSEVRSESGSTPPWSAALATVESKETEKKSCVRDQSLNPNSIVGGKMDHATQNIVILGLKLKNFPKNVILIVHNLKCNE